MTPLLVFGRTGQAAREVAQLAPGAIFLGGADFDLLSLDPALPIAQLQPRAVINAAAYTAVDEAERHPQAAQRLNAEAPGQMSRACAAHGIPFVHLSSDYVFDGEKTGAYVEADLPRPQTVYGRSKADGEIAVAAAGGAYAILRTSWVFSSHGSNFLKTMLRIGETQNEVDVVSDQTGRPTWARDVARAALEAAGHMTNEPLGVLHAAGPEAMSWAQFATRIFARATARGLPYAAVRTIAAADSAAAAPRPANSTLAIDAIEAILGWRPTPLEAALDACLDQLEAVH